MRRQAIHHAENRSHVSFDQRRFFVELWFGPGPFRDLVENWQDVVWAGVAALRLNAAVTADAPLRPAPWARSRLAFLGLVVLGRRRRAGRRG
ncbi:MAG: hypothetical protein R3B48_17125 [Kofleriaceae bacterium]